MYCQTDGKQLTAEYQIRDMLPVETSPAEKAMLDNPSVARFVSRNACSKLLVGKETPAISIPIPAADDCSKPITLLIRGVTFPNQQCLLRIGGESQLIYNDMATPPFVWKYFTVTLPAHYEREGVELRVSPVQGDTTLLMLQKVLFYQ